MLRAHEEGVLVAFGHEPSAKLSEKVQGFGFRVQGLGFRV